MEKFNNPETIHSTCEDYRASFSIDLVHDKEDAEKKLGPIHYKSKVHTVLKSAFDLATNKNILDVVEKILGPNILLYNVTILLKNLKVLHM